MLIEHVGLWNDISPELRTKLEEKVIGYGKRVRYKFDISHPNPDPEKRDGPVIWPNMYTLDPKTFTIVDRLEKREGKQKSKQIGLIDKIDDKNKPTRFKYVRVSGKTRGIFELNLDDTEEFAMAVYLEMHPKNKDGEFSDKKKQQVFERINEAQLAHEKRTERSVRLKALNDAQAMSDAEVVMFADAMQWDSTQELDILRSQIEDMAENEPVFYNEMRAEGNKTIEYQAMIRRAVDTKIISFDPTEYRYVWVGNNQTIASLPPVGGKTELQKMADWIATGGPKAEEAYKKIKKLVKE